MIYNGLDKEKPIKEIKAKNDKEVIEVYGGIGEEKPIYYKEETLTGTPPFYFKALGQPIKNWAITGGSGGVGEKTANLVPPGWAEDFVARINNSDLATIENDILTVAAGAGYGDYDNKYIFKTDWKENTVYTLTYRGRRKATDSTSGTIAFYYTDNSFTRVPYILINDGEWHIYKGTSSARKTVKYIAGWFSSGFLDIDISSFNVNEGEAPIVEPYGYKIPIICGGETTNIYLPEPLKEGEQITGEQTGISIPTVVGTNLLLINTTIQPTEVSFTNYLCPKEQTDFTPPTDFETIQALVRSNVAKDYFTVHESQIITTKENDNLTWDILGINHDTPTDSKATHSMTLQTHDCIASLQFDAPEAFYYCENGLAAGTYYFTIDSTYEPTINDLSAYQFTLTKDVPAGGQLTFPWLSGKASTIKVNSFASATSTTVIEQVPVTEGTDGQNLGNLTVAGDFSNNLNAIHRVRFGSNNYKESAIRQWLNSSAAAGSVWTPQTKWDRPPTWAATVDGFMYGMDTNFLSALGKTHIIVARNTVCDGGGFDEMDDYFFLPSRREVYMGSEVASVIEGEPYPYYADYSDLSAPGTRSDSNRIKYRGGTAQYWWNRTPHSGHSSHVRNVYPTGSLNHYYANGSFGVAPACNII